VYLDESGIDDTEDYPYGYSPKGTPCHALKPGSRKQRISMIAALRRKELCAPLTFEGYCDRNVFEAWVRQSLLPELVPGETVILDNASFHKSPKISQWIADAGCELLYLPPYSPDLNPIENRWATLKNTARKNIPLFPTFRQAVDAAFQ
jgi:transposase